MAQSDGRTMTGAQILWECLVREGVEVVFGYPGGAILPAYDAMLDYPVRHVPSRKQARSRAPGVTVTPGGELRAAGTASAIPAEAVR